MKAHRDDEELARSSSDEGSVEIAARPKKKAKAPPRAPTPTPRADPSPALLGVPPIEPQLSPSGCSFDSDCKFEIAFIDDDAQDVLAVPVRQQKAHHLCCNKDALLKYFIGELGGCERRAASATDKRE